MAYEGTSIVDYLKSVGQDSSYSSRATLATKYGIQNYVGSAEQNLSLLSSLRGSTAAPVAATPATVVSGAQGSVTPPVGAPAPTMPVAQPTSAASIINGQKAAYDKAQADYEKALAEREKLKADLATQQGKLATATQNQSKLAEEYQLPENTKKLQELNTLIAQTYAEYEQAISDVEGRAIPLQIISGQKADLERKYALRMSVYSAQSNALQGNITLAQNAIKNISELQMEPIKQNIANIEKFLSLNADTLNIIGEAKTTGINAYLSEEKARLATIEENNNDNQALALKVAQGGGDPSIVDYTKTYEENLQAAAPYLKDETSTVVKGVSGATLSSRLNQEIANVYAGRYGEEGAREKAIKILASEFPGTDVATQIYNRIPDGYETEIKKSQANYSTAVERATDAAAMYESQGIPPAQIYANLQTDPELRSVLTSADLSSIMTGLGYTSLGYGQWIKQ